MAFVIYDWPTAEQLRLALPPCSRHPYTLQPSNPPPIPLPAPSSGRAIRPSSAHPEPRRGPPRRQTPSLHSQTTAHRLDPASIPSILPLTPNQQRPPLKRRFPHLAPSASRRARPRPRPASTHRTAPRHARRLVWFAKPNRTSRHIRRCAATRSLELPLNPAPRTGFCSRHVVENPPELSACASSSAASPERGRRPPARPPARVGWRTTGAVLAALNAGHASGDAVTLADFRTSRGTRSGTTAPRRPSPARACSPWSKTTSGCGGGAARRPSFTPRSPPRRGSRSPISTLSTTPRGASARGRGDGWGARDGRTSALPLAM